MQENKMKRLVKETVAAFQRSPIQVKVKQDKDDTRWKLFLQTVDGEECLSMMGYETKELANHAALTKGYVVGNDLSDEPLPETVDGVKPSKRETTGAKKPEQMKLDKEKTIELKLENLIRKVLLKKKLNEENTELELEAKARRFAEIAQKIKTMEAEVKLLELEFTVLDKELTPLVEEVGKTKDTFIRAGKLLIKIERAGYEKTTKSYKTGFDFAISKLNTICKDLSAEALKLTESVSYVKSKISVVQNETVLNEENWINKIKTFFTSKIKKLFNLNAQANKQLDEIEKLATTA